MQLGKKVCQCCGGTKKLYEVSAKCSDMYHQQHIGGKEYSGYVPDWMHSWSDDYVEFTICRHCGHVQGEWPHWDKSQNPFKSGGVA